MTQQQALDILKSGANVFLTGEPGSGKTHTINKFVRYLREHSIEPAVTASTGIAATHIGGMTIHSWSGIGIKEDLTSSDLHKLAADPKFAKRILRAQVLIIDEISMLSQRTLSMVDAVCRSVRKIQEPFGGMQVVFVGDFFQLPPILKQATLESPHKQFAYNSPAWQRANPTVCYLTEQHRQDDPVFLNMLAAIRRNELEEEHFESIQSRIVQRAVTPIQIPRLFTRNVSVDKLNDERLQKLPGEHRLYVMTNTGRSSLVDTLKKGCLSPEQLYLKVGAVVMFTKNNPQAGYANGTLGVVRDLSEGFPLVEIRGGKRVVVTPQDWKSEEGGKLRAMVSQLPLRLAWAITIHKSQGMSMDAAAIDLSDVFEYGQGYVAISRVRRLSGLHLFGINEKAFQVHPEILQEDSNFKSASKEAQKNFSALTPEDLIKIQRKYLSSIGGTVDAHEVQEPKKKEKGDTALETLTLWKEGKTLEQICVARNLKQTTILGHLEELLEEQKINQKDLSRLLSPELERALPEIHTIFRETKEDKLTPIFAKLKGRYTYEQLKIARMLIKKNS
ncbi:MAG: ATPase [Candidatus Doudnabacteria bacterium]|nr:ATPase [Candidatus Doudnabacteria bacterium]